MNGQESYPTGTKSSQRSLLRWTQSSTKSYERSTLYLTGSRRLVALGQYCWALPRRCTSWNHPTTLSQPQWLHKSNRKGKTKVSSTKRLDCKYRAAARSPLKAPWTRNRVLGCTILQQCSTSAARRCELWLLRMEVCPSAAETKSEILESGFFVRRMRILRNRCALISFWKLCESMRVSSKKVYKCRQNSGPKLRNDSATTTPHSYSRLGWNWMTR